MAKAILLAEDSPDDELLFRRVLEKSRIENPVVVVRDGAETIAYLEGQGEYADRNKYPLPRILCVDVKMPKLDGFAVLEWLKSHPSVKEGLLVVVLTQFGDGSQIKRAYDLGAHSFLAKPFTQEESENLIQHFGDHWLQSSQTGTES